MDPSNKICNSYIHQLRFVSHGRKGVAHFCISDADAPTPLHNNRKRLANAIHKRNRVRVKKTHIALVGGRFDRAAFHDTPPFGSNMMSLYRRAPLPPLDCN